MLRPAGRGGKQKYGLQKRAEKADSGTGWSPRAAASSRTAC